jgi:gingipain R
MRKFLLSFILVILVFGVFAQKSYETLFNQPQSDVYEITYNVKDFNLAELTIDGVTYQTIDMGVSTSTNDKGWAQLPFISAAIELPPQKDVDLNIVYTDYIDIPLDYPLLPSRGTIYRNQDPSQIPYEVAPESLIDEFYPQQMVVMEDPFIFREVRGTAVRVFPFQYNSVTNTLRFYRSVRVQLVENNNPPTNPFLRERVSYISEIEGIYQDLFLNYNSYKPSASLTMNEYGDILVITTTAFESTMAPYITWKKEMGYNVTKTIVANGTNVATTISSAYSSNPNLLYVQLAGDWANIKSPTISVTTSADPCDAFMGAVSGSDNYIDISVGRFSCASTTDLTVQINKAINYEKSPNMTTGWRETFIGIGSNEGSGIGDDSEIDYTHIQRIYSSRLDPFTYNTHQQNYAPSASATTLAGHINSGASTIAYCGHGDVDMFVTTGFNNTNVNALTNGDKLPFIVSVACVNGSFHTETSCFAETWLRKSNGGAVVTWMSTINQPWQPPQRGQDYFYDVLIGGFNYDNDGITATTGYTTTQQRTRWGSIAVNAAVLMLRESSASDDIETIKTWTTFGDASLQLRTKIPAALTLSNMDPVVGSAYSGIAYVSGTPAANVLICLSKDGVYYSDMTDSNGAYSISHDFGAGDALLVATAFNSTTIYETVTLIDSDPCLPVNNLAVIANGTTANLSWTAPAEGNVTGYKIYRDGNYQTTVTGLNYSQSSLANGTYTYCVAAVFDGEECYAQECREVVINDGSNDDCESPTNLQISETSATIHDLSWTAPAGSNVIFDDIESHTAFTINSAGTVPWTFIDGDGQTTYSIANYTFTNQGLAMATIVFDPNLVLHSTNSTPLTQTTDGTPFTAHSGDQFFASFNASTGQTNDWIISPLLSFAEPFEFSFFARSGHKSAYPEAFKVAYSTTTNQQTAFTNTLATITSAPFAWTEYSYTVPANAKYVAINCNSNDMYYFCVDDIYIGDGSMPGANLTGYNVYCDGMYLGNTSNTAFTNSDASEGYHEYCVEAVYDNACISPQVCETIGTIGTTYTITASAGSNGSISPSGTSTVNEGSNKTYNITPATCYQIANVLVDGSSVGAVSTYTFTNIMDNHTISATFSQITYSISTSAGVGGSISGIGSSAVCGSSVSFTVSTEECYEVTTVTVNGTPVTLVGNGYTISNVSSNLNIVATFNVISYSVSTNAGTGGTITGAGTSVACGGDITFTVNHDACHEIATVTVNGTPVSLIGNSFTINDVDENISIVATFSQLTLSVTANAGTGGSITGAGTSIGCGDNLTFTVTPNECYEVLSVTVNGNPIALTSGNYIVTNVTSNVIIEATFGIEIYTITAMAGSGGTITPSGNSDFACHANQVFVITPDDNYIISAVYVDEVNQGAVAAYYFSNIVSDHTITVEFDFFNDINTDLVNGVTLFPNPANDYFDLVIGEVEDYSDLRIVGIDGKIISNQIITSKRMTIDISSFAEGIYFVQLLGTDKCVSIKLNKM